MGNAERWVGVGAAQGDEAFGAGKHAATVALSGRGDPKLAVVFFSAAMDARGLLDGIRAVLPDCELIGCSTAGEIAAAGPGTSGLVVTVFGGAFTVGTRVGRSAAADTRGAGSAAARCIDDVSAEVPYRAVIALSDGLAGDQEEVVRGLYEHLGAGVPLVGGCAGDDMKMVSTTQLHNDEVLADCVVAAALGSHGPVGIGVRHGWRRVGEPMLVTASVGNVVLRLDDRPALDVYLERLGADPSVSADAAAIAQFALTHPLGLMRRNREEIRFVSGADEDERSLTCIANVPQGGLAWLMEGDDDSVMAATDDACRDALDQLGGAEPLGMLAFDCIARREVLGSGIVQEVQRLAGHAAGASVAGFYTYGEIARTHGSRGFHNQTLVVFAVA